MLPVPEPALVALRASRSEIIRTDDAGPTRVAAELARSFQDAEARAAWVEEARVSAIVGSCPRSKREVCAVCVLVSLLHCGVCADRVWHSLLDLVRPRRPGHCGVRFPAVGRWHRGVVEHFPLLQNFR